MRCRYRKPCECCHCGHCDCFFDGAECCGCGEKSEVVEEHVALRARALALMYGCSMPYEQAFELARSERETEGERG